MRDIFQDKDFNRFLEGEVKHLDDAVGPLVYALFKKRVITSWSCAGHIGKWYMDVLGQALPGHLVYVCGKLHYNSGNEIFDNRIKRLKEQYSFVRLFEENPRRLLLEMEDIAILHNEKGYAKMQVPENLAQDRYNLFLEIWRDLTGFASGL